MGTGAPGGELENGLEVELALEGVGEQTEAVELGEALACRHEAEVPLGGSQGILFLKPAEHRTAGRVHDRTGASTGMAFGAGAVEHDAADVQRGIELCEAERGGGGAACGPGDVEHEQHGGAEELGDLGGGGALAVVVAAVEKPHHALDDGEVGACARPVKGGDDLLVREHPRIEVAARAAGRTGVVRRVEVVGAAFERLHDQSAPAQCGEQAANDGGLADAGVGARDDERGDGWARHGDDIGGWAENRGA